MALLDSARPMFDILVWVRFFRHQYVSRANKKKVTPQAVFLVAPRPSASVVISTVSQHLSEYIKIFSGRKKKE